MSESNDPKFPGRQSKCTWKPQTAEPSPHRVIERPQPKGKILPDILATMGDTPLVRLNQIPQEHGLECEVLAKCEFFNPGGSIKDRIIYQMITDAELDGKIKPGVSTLIEPTSGNTGIGLALIGALKGYKVICVIPNKISEEKEWLMQALGAQVVRMPNSPNYSYNDPDTHFVAKAHALAKEIPDSFVMEQFTNKSNPLCHYYTTADEIIEQCDGKIDAFVGSAGTGGHVTGIGRRLKDKVPQCKVVCVDPVLSLMAPSEDKTKKFGHFELEGMGYEFVPVNLDRDAVDLWIKMEDKEAFQMARDLIRKEGFLIGGSAGALMAGAIRAAKELKLGKGDRMVVMMPDGVRNYMTKFLSDQWMKERDFL